MKVLVNMWPGFVLSRSGDFYANIEVMAMHRQFPDLEFLLVRSPIVILAGNARVLLVKAMQKSGLVDFRRRIFKPLYYMQFVNYMPTSYPRGVGADILFAHAQYPWPVGKCPLPMVAVQYFASERHMRMAGTFNLLPLEIQAKRWSTGHARILLTTTPGSQARIEQYMPEFQGRVWTVPVYTPYVEPSPEADVLRKHQDASRIRVLFVGGEARRKGLPRLLEAMRLLDRSLRGTLQLTIVSSFRDGPVRDIENGIEVRSGLTVSQVIQLMRAAHIFAFPTQFESYGRVIIEAMASGCGVICSDTEPQDWMLEYGRCGVLVNPLSPEEIAAGLTLLVENRNARADYALAAVRRFREFFYHRVVADQYRRAFERAVES
jgi:glycosyltransferase involved in cell wall biosynthesis